MAALLKRTAGDPLSEAEHQQRVDAARARWAAAGLAAGGVGAAAAGYAAARKIRQIRERDQAHLDAQEPIRTAARARNEARAARHAAREAAVQDGLRPTGGKRWLAQSVKGLRRVAGQTEAEWRALYRKALDERGEWVDVHDFDSPTGFRREKLVDFPGAGIMLEPAQRARERIADILERGRASERVDVAAPTPHAVAAHVRQVRGRAVAVWEPDAQAKLEHLKQALGQDAPLPPRQPPSPPVANLPGAGANAAADAGTVLQGLPSTQDLVTPAQRDYRAKIDEFRAANRSTSGRPPHPLIQSGASDDQIARFLGIKKPREVVRAKAVRSSAEIEERRQRISADRDRREAELRAKLTPEGQARFDARKAKRQASARPRKTTKLDTYMAVVESVLANHPESEGYFHDPHHVEPAVIRDRLKRIRGLDSIERLVRGMPAGRRNEFLEAHLLPKLTFERPLQDVQVAPIAERAGGARRVTRPGYPDQATRRRISAELVANLQARGAAWRGAEAKTAAWRTARAEAAFAAATHRQAARLAVLGRAPVRRGLIGAAALLGGAAGYGAVRGLRGVFGATELGKAFDHSAHPRGERGRFAPRHLARTDFAREGEPPRVTLLVGMPGSGKSTWRALRMAQGAVRPTTVISTDDQVEDIGRQHGLNFSEAFKLLDHRRVDAAHRVALRVALKAGHDVVIDRVNASAKGRAKWLRRVPRHYESHAVVFDVPEDELRRRRAGRPGKVIPKRALGEMRDAYREPTAGEFDYVHRVRPSASTSDSGDALRKAAPKHPQDAADAAERQMQVRLARMFGAWTNTIEEKLLGPDAKSLHADMTADLSHAMQPLDAALEAGARVPVLVAGGDGRGGPGRTIAFSFLARSPTVTDFIERFRQDKIAELADEQREAIKGQLLDAAKKGASPQEMARRIKETIGLTSFQMQHVQNYRRELEELSPFALERKLRDKRFDSAINRAIESGTAIPGEKISRYVDAYHRKYLAYRATTIARTEGVGGASNGQAVTAAALLHDQPGMTVEKTWIATRDGRTRDDHRELNGQVVLGLDTPFRCESGDQIRWPHDPLAPARQVINCRCSFVSRLVPDSDAFESRNDLSQEEDADG